MRLLLLTILLLSIAGGVSCDRDDTNEPSTFRFINRGDVFTLDLNQMSYGQDFRVAYALREGLFTPTGEQFKPVPAGAERYELSPDGKTYTFYLRKNALWSNGDPVVAGDYIFSWKMMLENPGEYTYLYYSIHNAEAYQKAHAAGTATPDLEPGFRAIDDHTIEVKLDQPVTYFTDLLAFPPFYPRHAKSMAPFRSEKGDYDNRYTRPPAVVTNGPFRLVDWKFKRILRMEKNPYYYNADQIVIDAIENVVNENPLSQLLQFDAGAVQWVAEVPPDLAADLRADGRSNLHTCMAFGTAFLTLYSAPNFDPAVLGGMKNPLADMRVRQALAMAIDKRFITEKITRNGEVVATQYVPPGTLPGYTQLPGLPHDVARARQLLAEAGYPDGQGFPQLPLLYNSENLVRAKIAQSLGQQWKQNLGIDIRIEGIEGKIFQQRVSQHQYAIATVSWYGDYPDVSTFTDKYRSTSQQNDSSWINEKYDALLDAAANDADPVRRLGTLRDAEALLNTEVPIIPLYHHVNATLIAPNLRGFEANSRNMIDWRRIVIEAKP